MSPDEAYLEKQAQAEEEKLQKKIQALSDGDRKEIYGKGKNSNLVSHISQIFRFCLFFLCEKK